MKKFALFVISILLLIVLIMVALDFSYTAIYSNCNPRNNLQYILKIKEKKYDVVFIGSSRVADHVDSELFDSISHLKTINFGVEGANLNDNLLQLKLLFKENTARFVFLQVDNNLESTAPSNISTAIAMPFISKEIVKQHTRKYLSNFAGLNYIPFYRYAVNDAKIGFREMFFSLNNKKPRIDPSKGFTPKFGNSIPKSPKTIMGENVTLNKNAILEEIQMLCESNHAKLVLFITPVCSKITPDSYILKMRKITPDLIDLTKGYPDAMFYNCGHLNEEGAKKLTTELFKSTKNQLN